MFKFKNKPPGPSAQTDFSAYSQNANAVVKAIKNLALVYQREAMDKSPLDCMGRGMIQVKGDYLRQNHFSRERRVARFCASLFHALDSPDKILALCDDFLRTQEV